MSTRAQLAVYESEEAKIENAEVYIYRHSDGYPGTKDGEESGVLPDIIPFLKTFDKFRGIGDTSYCTARLIQHLTNQYDGAASGGEQSVFAFIGFGVDRGGTGGLHGDIDYFYHISPTAIKVYEVKDPEENALAVYGNEKVATWKVIDRVELESKQVAQP